MLDNYIDTIKFEEYEDGKCYYKKFIIVYNNDAECLLVHMAKDIYSGYFYLYEIKGGKYYLNHNVKIERLDIVFVN